MVQELMKYIPSNMIVAIECWGWALAHTACIWATMIVHTIILLHKDFFANFIH